jgi:hypothetical protein
MVTSHSGCSCPDVFGIRTLYSVIQLVVLQVPVHGERDAVISILCTDVTVSGTKVPEFTENRCSRVDEICSQDSRARSSK